MVGRTESGYAFIVVLVSLPAISVNVLYLRHAFNYHGFWHGKIQGKRGGISLVGETKTSSPSLAGFPLSKCFSFLFLISKTLL